MPSDLIAEKCAQIAEEWIIPAERMHMSNKERRAFGFGMNTAALEIAAAIRERMGEKK